MDLLLLLLLRNRLLLPLHHLQHLHHLRHRIVIAVAQRMQIKYKLPILNLHPTKLPNHAQTGMQVTGQQLVMYHKANRISGSLIDSYCIKFSG